MVLLYASYFDASGKPGRHPVLSVAGAVAPVKKWIRFERDWQQVLKDEGVTEFHATDFAASRKEYEGWKDDKPRRTKFLNRLGKIIKDNTNKLFMVSVEIDAWDSVISSICWKRRSIRLMRWGDLASSPWSSNGPKTNRSENLLNSSSKMGTRDGRA
jgi:hypothetical protein